MHIHVQLCLLWTLTSFIKCLLQPKLHLKFQSNPLKIFEQRRWKCKKPINSFLKIIFDLQVGIPRVHPVKIASHSDYWQNVENAKNAKKQPSLKYRGLVPYYTARAWTVVLTRSGVMLSLSCIWNFKKFLWQDAEKM